MDCFDTSRFAIKRDLSDQIASLMKRPVGIDSEAWLRHCVDAANALRVDESIKVDILERLMILSGLEYDHDTDQPHSLTGGSYGRNHARIVVYTIHQATGY